MNNEFISFSATLNGKDVRITCSIKDVEIVSRDNEESFNVEENAHKLESIEFEDTY